MARDDSDDAVFEQAVTAALEQESEGDPVLLRRAVDVARPWVMAQAGGAKWQYVYRSARAASLTANWAGRRPMLWRWAFIVAIPTITWALLPWIIRLEPPLIGKVALVALATSLVAIAVSYAGSAGRKIGRAWALVSLAGPSGLAGILATTSLGWSAWWWGLVAAAVFLPVFFESAVNTVLPTAEMIRATAAAEQAFDSWCSAVQTDGVRPVLRAELRSRQVVQGTELHYRNAEDLQRGGTLISHQPVPAGRKLADQVRGLDGGSFALAGPRGAGKTSVLEAVCDGVYREPEERLALAIMVAAPVDYVPREFVLYLYARTCHAVIAHVEDINPKALKAAGRRDRWWRSLPDDPELVWLVRSARRGLQSIAYVQTSSGESSAKVGFRGAEITVKRSVSLAGRPATYPEVVDDFRSFVRLVAWALAPTRLVIAIDEMDRIGTGEAARRFLNEIKAIFDVPGCYYLMSVSTEAQHDFELAGVGLRTVFDSSFDEVVRVDYLDFELARGLISRSVEDLPDPFVALAYAFSGGLARQLTRSARAIVRQPRGTLLAAVADELIADELDRVCKTTGDALTSSENHDGVTTLLRVLADPQRDLRDYRKAIQAAYDGENAAITKLRDLAAARIEFLAVVRDYFTNGRTEVLPEQVNALARARRYAGSNPATGLALLAEFSAAARERPAPTPPLQ